MFLHFLTLPQVYQALMCLQQRTLTDATRAPLQQFIAENLEGERPFLPDEPIDSLVLTTQTQHILAPHYSTALAVLQAPDEELLQLAQFGRVRLEEVQMVRRIEAGARAFCATRRVYAPFVRFYIPRFDLPQLQFLLLEDEEGAFCLVVGDDVELLLTAWNVAAALA